jgi:hypothetical protein
MTTHRISDKLPRRPRIHAYLVFRHAIIAARTKPFHHLRRCALHLIGLQHEVEILLTGLVEARERVGLKLLPTLERFLHTRTHNKPCTHRNFTNENMDANTEQEYVSYARIVTKITKVCMGSRSNSTNLASQFLVAHRVVARQRGTHVLFDEIQRLAAQGLDRGSHQGEHLGGVNDIVVVGVWTNECKQNRKQ